MSIKNILILFLFIIFSCENPISNQPIGDCIADQGGFIDDCGVCSGGTSDHIANSDKDCSSFNINIISEEIIESLGLQTWYLNKNIEYHLMGNHLFRNAKALFFAGSFLNTEYSQNWLTKGAEIIKKELEEQVLNDGGNFELSPMYHCNMLQDILDLINLQNRYPSEQLTDLLEKLHHKALRMLRWLSFMTHPDGEVAFFNDAAFKMSLNLSELRKYAQELGIEDQTEDSGTTIYLKDSGSPVLIKDFLDKNSFHVVMPMKI